MWQKGDRKMKRAGRSVIVAMLAALILTGCTKEKKEQVPKEETDKIQVMVSFFPMYDFAQKIGGNRAEVTNMVPAGTEPHDWEPSTKDIQKLEMADMFIYSGEEMEYWAEDVLTSVETNKLEVVEASKTVDKLKEEGVSDPHVWLDPMNAKLELEQIKEGFLKVDPENSEYYEKNYETCVDRLEELDRQFEEIISKCEKKEIVVYHEAFGYLCNAYGLLQVGITGISPEEEPSPKQMEEVIHFIQEKDVTTIFFEALSSSKTAEIIAEETGVKTEILNPLEGPGVGENQGDYFSIMENNLKVLKEALQ